jgi:hypothetical protein
MRFSNEGLVLGAGTVLARSHGSSRDISIDPLDQRLPALLGAAHLRNPSYSDLAHLRKAADCWSNGEDALAAMHLALSRLEKLREPEADAHRLFLADGLLKHGIPADEIAIAVEMGPAAFERLHKYNADQPRVPAGSGRPSGQWTSGSGPAGAAGFVNPSAATPASMHNVMDACTRAHMDCVDAAVYASRNDAANDNSRFVDLRNCKEAEWACDTLSWIVEDLPLPLGGGVRFPHGGVVLIDKGLPDRYYPPLPNGRPWPIRRAAKSAPASASGEVANADSYSCPPWTVAPGETVSSDPAGFDACLTVISALAERVNGKVTEQSYSMSKQWGKIVRAKIAYEHKGSGGGFLVICWSETGSDVKIALQVDTDCAP